MPKPTGTRGRVWGAAWAVLCAAGLATTAELNASSAADARSETPVSTRCAEYIADVERRLAEAGQDDERGGVPAFSNMRVGTGDDCDEELHDHFAGDR